MTDITSPNNSYVQPKYIVHWAMLVVLFSFVFNSIDTFYMNDPAFYGDPIDSHVFKDRIFCDEEYVCSAKHGGYNHLRYYFSFLLLDLIFPLVYSALLWSCMQIIKNKWFRVALATTIILGAAFDYLEDISFSIYLAVDNENLARLVAVFTVIKTVLLVGNGIIAIIALLVGVKRILTKPAIIKSGELQTALMAIGIGCIPLILLYTFKQTSLDDRLKVLGAAAGAYFIVYKAMTGWLFINMTLRLSVQREPLDRREDHLAIHLTLSKGKIDSFWLEDIRFIITSESGDSNEYPIVHPAGYKKIDTDPVNLSENKQRLPEISSQYVLSPEEETTFSGYSKVKKGTVITILAVVIGTRPFYGLESAKKKPIIWQTSLVVLPIKKQDE